MIPEVLTAYPHADMDLATRAAAEAIQVGRSRSIISGFRLVDGQLMV
jgi:hypothetical protein